MAVPKLPFALALLSLACASTRSVHGPPAAAPEPPPERAASSPKANPFLHAVGRDLVDGQGRKVLLRGITFGNDVWGFRWVPPPNHHREQDFRDLRGMGMNAIRFHLSYRFFEDDDEPFHYQPDAFAWLDQNFAWARAHGIYLVLNMHVPPGGFQSTGGGAALWNDPRNQDRLVALWKEIARRYKDEPALAGYGLLNEPVVAGEPDAWERLARRTTAAIREVDPLHALFVERLLGVMPAGGGTPDYSGNRNGSMNLFRIDDENVVYEFHFYDPLAFTHQGAQWMPSFTAVATSYPGPFKDWDGSTQHGDRAYLERELARYFEFGRKENVPLFLGEFGVIRQGFAEGRNGAGWAADVIDLALAEGVSLTYHTFHEGDFGLYGISASSLPDRRNDALWEVFAKKFGALEAR
jgi:aryl-phospho-beta-D-glucosidase BglC (GH1 family)